MSKPNPGSDEAIKQGCICPAMDNAHGRGIPDYPTRDGSPAFWTYRDCPLHGHEAIEKEAAKND